MHLLNGWRCAIVVETDECLIVEMDNRPDLADIRGALQGGLVATLIDIAAGQAGRHATSAPARTSRPPTSNVHFLAPIVDGPARAVATVVRVGKRLVVIAVDVTDVGRDRLAARATLTSPCSTVALTAGPARISATGGARGCPPSRRPPGR